MPVFIAGIYVEIFAIINLAEFEHSIEGRTGKTSSRSIRTQSNHIIAGQLGVLD